MTQLAGGRTVDEEQRARYRTEAERGDLRPQVNPHAPAALGELGPLHELRPILLDRFWQLRRPIADALRSPAPEMRLSDIGSFLYLVETLRRLGYPNIEEMLGILLDEFSPFEERSYDELYLWCIVQLCRTDAKYVQRYWPDVLLLDVNFRNEDWRHDADCHLIDQPYRLTDLVLYYYAIYTRNRRHPLIPSTTIGVQIRDLFPGLTPAQRLVASRAVRRLRRPDPPPPQPWKGQVPLDDLGFSDACGLLAEWERRQQAAESPVFNKEDRP